MIVNELRKLADMIEAGAPCEYALQGGVESHPVHVEDGSVYVQRAATGVVALCLLVGESEQGLPPDAAQRAAEGVRGCLGDTVLTLREDLDADA